MGDNARAKYEAPEIEVLCVQAECIGLSDSGEEANSIDPVSENHFEETL